MMYRFDFFGLTDLAETLSTLCLPILKKKKRKKNMKTQLI